MSYQVLARKWRPYQFSGVVGQVHVLKALCNTLEYNRLHHAYLFSGTRGVGKTTIARIFAKGLNCDLGVSAKPCGQCTSCIEIEQGRCVDLLEIDAASRTRVEDTRELLDNVPYKPTRCRYKIYLIDEVHMLSRNSFNALLKTLEEPPEYVKFILATTDPQKLPITILSRCLQFHLKPLQPEQIKDQLAHILKQEQIAAQPKALALLAHAADGSMRDALSLADQAIALGAGQVSDEQVSEMLGTISTDKALTLIETLVKANAKSVFDVLDQFTDIGMEWDSLLKELALQFHRIALAQMLEESVDNHSPDAERLLLLAKKLTPEDVQLYYQIILQGRQDLPYAANAKSGFEMVILRLLAFKPFDIPPMPISGIEHQHQCASSAPTKKANQNPPNVEHKSLLNSATTAATTNAQLAMQRTEWQPNESEPIINQNDNLQQQINKCTDERIPESSLPVKSTNSLVATRHLLRSQSKQSRDLQQVNLQVNTSKRLNSMPSSAIAKAYQAIEEEKLTVSKHETAPVQEQKEYRWQPRISLPNNAEERGVATEKLKSILSCERSEEMRKRLEQESLEQDNWSKIVSGLTSISQMSKQLALNAAMKKQGDEIQLFLRYAQSHLNTEKNRMELTKALIEQLGDITLTVLLDDSQGTTPFEWRDKIYAEKLAQAVKSLHADSNISFIRERYAAILDEDSIRPI